MAPQVLIDADLAMVLYQAEHSQATRSGGNSTVTRVQMGTLDYAVKDYSGRKDGLSRQSQETAALKLLNPELKRFFAQPMGVSSDGLRAVHSWIDGVRPETNDATVSSMLEILIALHEMSQITPQSQGRHATDQIITAEQFRFQMETRIPTLLSGPPQIQDLTRSQLIPSTAALLNTHNEIGYPLITLSPSDFGAHNLLWNDTAKSIHCVDLEFFGWDDAHKLVCDTLLHPLSQWTQETAGRFLAETTSLYRLEIDRLAWLWPRLCLKWAAIYLARASSQASMINTDAKEEALQRALRSLRQAQESPLDTASMVSQVTVSKREERV